MPSCAAWGKINLLSTGQGKKYQRSPEINRSKKAYLNQTGPGPPPELVGLPNNRGRVLPEIPVNLNQLFCDVIDRRTRREPLFVVVVVLGAGLDGKTSRNVLAGILNGHQLGLEQLEVEGDPAEVVQVLVHGGGRIALYREV